MGKFLAEYIDGYIRDFKKKFKEQKVVGAGFLTWGQYVYLEYLVFENGTRMNTYSGVLPPVYERFKIDMEDQDAID